MRARNESEWSRRFVVCILPWLLAGGMSVLYLLTLDHWVSLENLRQSAALGGLVWLAELSAPVTQIVTYPLHWLPASVIPIAANLFATLCAALTLALLARSVAILPHDRTRTERYRNSNRLWYLETANAWLPPTLAVLVCGLQLTFWENSIAATGEMVDLLIFAYLIRCLLEFRLGRKNSWLYRFAFVFGLAMANNWAMFAFAPAFLVALFWINGGFHYFTSAYVTKLVMRKAEKPDVRLALKMFCFWLPGFLVILLLPILASHSRTNPVPFWNGLRYTVQSYRVILTAFPMRMVLLLGATSVLPVFFMGIRWGQLVDEANPLATAAVRALFHIVHASFLVACVWSALDAPFSPAVLQPLFACLPLYYLGALSVGYFSGYFLLVFGARNDKDRRITRPPTPIANIISIGAMWVLLLAAPVLLAQKNWPDIRRRANDSVAAYFQHLIEGLPAKGAIIISEDTSRLVLLEENLIRDGRQSDYLLVDGSLLVRFPAYFDFLARTHPEYKLADALPEHSTQFANPAVMVRWTANLSRERTICFLHPFAGYLTEFFYGEPHGLYYELKLYPTNSLHPPALSPELIAVNSNLWQSVERDEFPRILPQIAPPPPKAKPDPLANILEAAQTRREKNYNAKRAGEYYSLMLDAWGVELQRMGRLTEAGNSFARARELNPENAIAQINLQCNRSLQAKTPVPLESFREIEDRLGRNRNWDEALVDDGPVDEPNACDALGMLSLRVGMQRQAAQYFEREEELAPANTNAPLRLCEIFLRRGDNSDALAQADRVLRLAPGNSRALVLRALALVQLGKYSEALPPLDQLIASQTNSEARLTRAVAYLKLNKLQAAQADYEQVVRESPTAYPAYYGLASIAHENKDTSETIKNCELFLSNAPPNQLETPQVTEWLKESKAGN